MLYDVRKSPFLHRTCYKILLRLSGQNWQKHIIYYISVNLTTFLTTAHKIKIYSNHYTYFCEFNIS